MENYPKFSYFLIFQIETPLLILSTVWGQFVDFYSTWPWSGGIHPLSEQLVKVLSEAFQTCESLATILAK